MISVLNYGMGNVASVSNMLRRAGAVVQIIEEPCELEEARAIVLPGVGAYDEAVASLHGLGLWAGLQKIVREGKVPVLGICLGMQLLLENSEEGVRSGLGAIPGKCRRFHFGESQRRLKVPHMGWAGIVASRSHRLLDGLALDSRFYFVHSYYAECRNPADVIATARYGSDFAAVIGAGNVMGTQFHPEKSHNFGLRVLTNFARLVS